MGDIQGLETQRKQKVFEAYNEPYSHSLAKFILKEKGLKLYWGDRQILELGATHSKILGSFKIPKFHPQLVVGTFEKSSNIIEVTDCKKLMEIGYVLVSKEPYFLKKVKYKFRYKYEYSLKTINEPINLPGCSVRRTFPLGSRVLYDTTFRKACFEYGGKVSEWVQSPFGEKPRDAENKRGISLTTNYADRLYFARYGKMPDASKNRILEIDEMFIMGVSLTERKLVCIPESKDGISIGFIGKKGSYKSTAQHSLLDQCFVKNYPSIILNDWKYETDTYSNTMRTVSYIKTLGKLEIKPFKLPCVYLSVNTKEKDNLNNLIPEIIEENLHFYFTLPWDYFRKYYSEFTSKHHDAEMGKTIRYLNIEGLDNARTREEIHKVLEPLNNRQDKSKYEKAKSIFDFFIDMGIFDIDSKVPSDFVIEDTSLKTKTKLFAPLALMYAGLIPSIFSSPWQTVQMGRGSFLPSIANINMKRIYEAKKNEKFFYGKHMFEFIDEIGTIIREGVYKPIIDTFTLGRSERICIVYSNQSYSDLLEQVKQNTDYLGMMKLGSKEERDAIAKDFGYKASSLKLEKVGMNKDRPGQYMLFHREPIVLYDLDNGDRLVDEDTPILIDEPLPPMSMHKKPRGVDVEEQ